jgi:hypothetical protein
VKLLLGIAEWILPLPVAIGKMKACATGEPTDWGEWKLIRDDIDGTKCEARVRLGSPLGLEIDWMRSATPAKEEEDA